MRRSAVILIGPPGSGKTTITERLTANEQVQALEAGVLLREEVKRGTELGEKLKPFLDEGKLAPTEMVAEVIASGVQRLEEKVILFDGFPRQEEQLATFLAQIEKNQLDLAAVLVLELARDVAIERLTDRGERPEDNPDTINERLDIYEQETGPVIEYFEAHYGDRTYKESADRSVAQIVDSIVGSLQQAGLEL